jgi:hypothetical protein
MILVNVAFATSVFILQLHHLQEEMVIVKECYAQCNEAKTQLTQDLVLLQQEYSNLIGSSSVVSNGIIQLLKLYLLIALFLL